MRTTIKVAVLVLLVTSSLHTAKHVSAQKGLGPVWPCHYTRHGKLRTVLPGAAHHRGKHCHGAPQVGFHRGSLVATCECRLYLQQTLVQPASGSSMDRVPVGFTPTIGEFNMCPWWPPYTVSNVTNTTHIAYHLPQGQIKFLLSTTC